MKNTLEIKKVTKQFANHLALDQVDLSIPSNTIYGLLGPNGAGKTTLIRIINQITAPDSGHVFLNGEPLKPEHVHEIGYLPEERGLYKKMKVGEQCLYLAQLKGMSKSEARKKLHEWFVKFEIDEWWNKKIEELSKGMAQKIQFITTVIHEPKLLILDEPFSGFDPINVKLILKEIQELKEKGSTIILSTHNMESAEEMCDHIALINHGKVILEGGVEEVKNSHKENIFQLKFKGNIIKFTNALWTNFELIDSKSIQDNHTCKIKLLGDKTLNDLLSVTLNEVEVQEVFEIIPSLREVFIQEIGNEKKNNEITNKNPKGDE